MLYKTLSFARVGAITLLVYLAWSQASTLWATENLSLTGWVCLIYMVVIGTGCALGLILAALILLFCMLHAAAESLQKYLKVFLRDVSSLPCGR
jgi:hypothetical protein